ncbi:uncharacterized protein A1O9_07785 [Exophiala aquamarina CBS 119918]|uniref:AHC1-like C2H2 zinc-finger domain-containing protein n=1 Tax=Exophiala aquamarina CBS 119918 TaxID=1182545 RepID=A0A072P7W4_9EURO|nr:uncharacterized protein A1O9_07785 [Exophiala aquamarina CBS 119918]KEF56204.1 hypothetical protein A1O9_07785 [Exophiala aquamarina CBS 119918]
MSFPLKRKTSVDQDSEPEKKRSKVSNKAQQGFTQSSSSASIHNHDIADSKQLSTTAESPSFLPTPPEMKQEDDDGGLHSTNQVTASERLESIRSVIQTQMSLEILLKHKELRLIDQEIAKAQVALEQLRRCTEIPYPATQQLSVGVSNGVGSSLRSTFKIPLPESPAPWGVVDGPYSRHYAKWLLPDHRFDGGEPETLPHTSAGKSPMKSRSMRGSFTEIAQPTNSSRSQRSGKLKALPAGYGQPKEKATGPMIVKRKSDGVMVKLVCPDCGRHDFGSAQGFINHCRIGHGRSFASHDAAADACGEPVEYDDSGAMVGVEPVLTPTGGNVHPLIRSAKLLPPGQTQLANLRASNSSLPTPKKTSPDFKASGLTPHLSDLIKNRGLGLDLQDIVSDAKTRIQLPESDSEDEDTEVDTPIQPTGQGRHPQVAGSKQLQKPAKSPMASPLLSTSMNRSAPRPRAGDFQHYDGVNEAFTPHRPRSMALPITHGTPTQLTPSDPSPTSESNQAPSLVDDDEEYEAHSPASSAASDDIGEVEFEVQGDDDDARSVLPAPEFQASCAPTRPTHVRRPSAIRRQGEEREEKHVSFLSPSPARELGVPRQLGERKKRRT